MKERKRMKKEEDREKEKEKREKKKKERDCQTAQCMFTRIVKVITFDVHFYVFLQTKYIYL